MNFLKKFGCAAALSLATAAAHAGPVLNDWVFNPVGGGYASGHKIGEYLDVNGNAFIELSSTGGNTFSFKEHAVFNIVQADSKGVLFPVKYPGGNITATFEATGNGVLGTGSGLGNFTFSGGTIKMYQNPTNGQYSGTEGFYGANLGNLIAEFTVLAGGGGQVNADGSPLNNGNVTVWAKAEPGMLEPGYFFRNGGADLAEESILSFAFTNANTVGEPDETQISEIACEFAGFTGPGCDGDAYANTPNSHFFVSNNGSFKLAEIPEPGSLALLGIAMLGAGVVSRKRVKKA